MTESFLEFLLERWTLTQISVMAVAAMTVFAYLGRVGALNLHQHRFLASAWHVMLLWAAINAGWVAYMRAPNVNEIGMLCISAVWILVSCRDWRYGVPSDMFKNSRSLMSDLDDMNDQMHR